MKYVDFMRNSNRLQSIGIRGKANIHDFGFVNVPIVSTSLCVRTSTFNPNFIKYFQKTVKMYLVLATNLNFTFNGCNDF